MKSFKDCVFGVVRRIPAGKVLTYKAVAQLAGRPKAYRAVGNILNTNYDPAIPCHRVVRSDGKTGGYNRGTKEKQKRLKREGALLTFLIAIIGTLLFFPDISYAADLSRPIPIKPEHARPTEVRVWDSYFTTSSRFMAFDSKRIDGGFVSAGDVDGDGKDDIIVGSGPRSEAEIRVFNINGVRISSFTPYPKGFRGGVRVAVGDIDSDGKAEIITAPGPGLEPRIRVFNYHGQEKLPGILVYAKSFVGGVRIATGDVDGDGKAEIITAPGPGGGPHIRIFNGKLENIGQDFFAYDPSMTDGVTVAAIRTSQGTHIVTGVESWSAPLIKRFQIFPQFQFINEFLVAPNTDRAGVIVAAFDIQGDEHDEIVVTRNGGTRPELSVFDQRGTKMGVFLVHDPNYRGAFSVSQLNDGGKKKLATLPLLPLVTGPWDKEKFIEVDISEQRLYAYERGRVAKTFLVSTGTYRFPTPLGKTTVQKKVPIMDYRWSYGRNHPDNYFLPNVKYNVRVFPNIFIHSAYWHSNFGHRMSHGCINTSLKDAEWVYNWAQVGTFVEVRA